MLLIWNDTRNTDFFYIFTSFSKHKFPRINYLFTINTFFCITLTSNKLFKSTPQKPVVISSGVRVPLVGNHCSKGHAMSFGDKTKSHSATAESYSDLSQNHHRCLSSHWIPLTSLLHAYQLKEDETRRGVKLPKQSQIQIHTNEQMKRGREQSKEMEKQKGGRKPRPTSKNRLRPLVLSLQSNAAGCVCVCPWKMRGEILAQVRAG